MKEQSFLTGAAILMAANAISKILGAVFKIPLTYILHEDGMAVFNVAFQVYIMFLTFIISGLPLAVSKTVAESLSRKNKIHAYNIVKVATLILSAIGILGSVILYFGAEFFALAMKEAKAVTAIKCIAPSVFFVAIGTAYKSYYQGTSNMIPTAVSQVAEAIVKLAAGYMLSLAFISSGIEKTAGGAIFGVTIGEVLATAMLMVMYFYDKRGESISYMRGERREIVNSLMSITIPILAAAVLSNVISLADTTVIRMRLLDSGLSEDKARYLYGAYTGYAMTVFHLPPGILATLGVSILPVISGAVASGREERAAFAAMSGIQLTLYLSIPFAVVLYMLPFEILDILFSNTASAYMLKIAAPSVVMLCVSQIASSAMQAAGRITEPLIYMFIGSVAKIILSWVLIGKSEFNIYGAVLAADAGYFIVMIICLIAAGKFLNLKYDIGAMIIKPAFATALMYIVISFIKRPLISMNMYIGFFAVCAVGGMVYVSALLFTGAVKISEVIKLVR